MDSTAQHSESLPPGPQGPLPHCQQTRHRKQGPCWPLGCLEMPSSCSRARWALTKYASMGCSEGSVRKKQKHLAPRMAWGGNNCKQSRSWLALLSPRWVWRGDCRGQLLGFIPSWLLIPGCWVTTCGRADVCPVNVRPLHLSPLVPTPSTGFIDSFIDDAGA